MKNHQKIIRADLYNRVEDDIHTGDVETSGASILAASFTGGNRWYSKGYKNAMAIVRAKGKPDLFITMTLDVNCQEVKD